MRALSHAIPFFCVSRGLLLLEHASSSWLLYHIKLLFLYRRIWKEKSTQKASSWQALFLKQHKSLTGTKTMLLQVCSGTLLLRLLSA